MAGVYFSGTGNTRYCIDKFVHDLDTDASCISIEHQFAVQTFDNPPKAVIREAVFRNKAVNMGIATIVAIQRYEGRRQSLEKSF